MHFGAQRRLQRVFKRILGVGYLGLAEDSATSLGTLKASAVSQELFEHPLEAALSSRVH